MKRIILIITLMLGISITMAQANANDSLIVGSVHIIKKDYRIDVLGKKMAEYNEAIASRPGGIKMVRGYRLMILSTSDRNLAMGVRTKLLQQYPDQKVYMTFQSPYIKLKFGNYVEKGDAEKYRKQITTLGVVNNNIYLVPETVEVKIDKNAPLEE